MIWLGGWGSDQFGERQFAATMKRRRQERSKEQQGLWPAGFQESNRLGPQSPTVVDKSGEGGQPDQAGEKSFHGFSGLHGRKASSHFESPNGAVDRRPASLRLGFIVLSKENVFPTSGGIEPAQLFAELPPLMAMFKGFQTGAHQTGTLISHRSV